VDFVREWSDKTEIAAERFVGWIGISRGKYYDWRKRYGKANEHNALILGITGSRLKNGRPSSPSMNGFLWKAIGG
jgi:hypothetical protein